MEKCLRASRLNVLLTFPARPGAGSFRYRIIPVSPEDNMMSFLRWRFVPLGFACSVYFVPHEPLCRSAYFSGKMLAKMGRVALIAEEMGRHDDARRVAARLAEASQVGARVTFHFVLASRMWRGRFAH